MAEFLVDVDTRQLTRILKNLSKLEKQAAVVRLEYRSGLLTISAARTSYDIPAVCSWPQPVSVARSWAIALGKNSVSRAITTLRMGYGKLWARDLGVVCSMDSSVRESSAGVKRRAQD